MKKILIMNGPNLNLLGEREPNIYGNETLNTINDDLDEKARKLGYEPVFFQSNSEGGLIDRLHESRLDCAGVILNAGAYTHYSYAIPRRYRGDTHSGNRSAPFKCQQPRRNSAGIPLLRLSAGELSRALEATATRWVCTPSTTS